MHRFIMKAIGKGLERGPALQEHCFLTFQLLWVFKTYIAMNSHHKIIFVADL